MGQQCARKKQEPEILAPHADSEIKRVYAVMSGKGGVGKSLVTGLLAIALRRRGYQVGILDGDITGPSIPKMFGLDVKPVGMEDGLFPVYTRGGIKVMSLNLLLPHEDDPVIWRGPILSGAVRQFWTDVIWGRVDYLLIDLPPGTGDVPLTVMQSIPLNGLIVVTLPQDLSALIVRKAVKMAMALNKPVVGVVENMAYALCPRCGEEVKLFGDSHSQQITGRTLAPLLARLPVDPRLAFWSDTGGLELCDENLLAKLEPVLEKICE
ncbi:MAG: P-loop NTPase [Desulfotomaculales bacterium]